jgi:hypothetical protein
MFRCFEFLYNFCPEHFSFYEELSEIWHEKYIGLQGKYPSFLPDFNETYCSVQTEERTDGRTDKTKQIVDILCFGLSVLPIQ